MNRKLKGLFFLTVIASAVGFGTLGIERASASDFRRRVDRDVRKEFPNGARFRRDINREFRRDNDGFERRIRREVRREFPNGREVRRKVDRRVERDFGFRGFGFFR